MTDLDRLRRGAEIVEELGYLAGLLRTEGDENVPRGSVSSYLDLQAGVAERADADEIELAIRTASELVLAGDWIGAREVLVAEIARLR